MSVAPLRVHDAPAAPRPLAGRGYYSPITHDLTRDANAGVISWADVGIVQNLLMGAPIGATTIRRTIASIAKEMDKTEETIRSGVKRLCKAGHLSHERDRDVPGSPYLFTIYRRPVLALKPDDVGEVYSGIRRGDHTSYDKSKCNHKQIKGCTHKPVKGCTHKPVGGSSLFSSRESLETTTTDPGVPPQVGASNGDPSSSFSSLSVQAPEPKAAPEAPGSPQSDRREETDESPQPAAPTSPGAAQTSERAAKAFPSIPAVALRLKLREAYELWAAELKRRGKPASQPECLRAVDLAVEYAALMAAKDGVARDWPYVLSTIKRWACNGWTLDECEGGEVKPLRPKDKPVVVEVERVRLEPPSAKLAAAEGALFAAGWKLPDGPEKDAEVARLQGEVDAIKAREAQEKSRRGGVSPYPPAGLEP